MKVLLCGHRSFAAKGLIAALQSAGHEVTAFSRGPIAASDNIVTGPVDQLHENPHLLDKPFDTVINYIVLKDEPVEPNIRFMNSLLEFCKRRSIKHLIHISSISSYKASETNVTEDAADETEPTKKGPYGALKVAQDQAVINRTPPGTKVSLVRPGFVLGSGLMNPIIGTAARLPWNKLLVIGNAQSQIPVTTRDLVNQAVTKLVSSPPSVDREVIMLASPESPTRHEFLQACCKNLGTSTGVVHVPVPLWWIIAVGSELAARILGQGKLKPYSKLAARLPKLRFNPTKSQQRLNMDLRCDWQKTLKESLDGQQQNFQLPYYPTPLPKDCKAKSITFLGFGRIVRQKHLPALRKMNFTGNIRACDLRATKVDDIQVEAIEGAELGKADLFVVASPGPAHVKSIDSLASAQGPVLIEKPLCYTPAELERFKTFAANRSTPVYVCHNYRYKSNVAQMIEFLTRYNPGQLRHASVDFQSPPVAADSAAWMRNERRARTFLLDYSLHFMDLATMFSTDPWSMQGVRHTLNPSGETNLIEGRLTGPYSVSFLLRQGFAPRRARVIFDFQNYSIILRFFPDTFVPYLSDDNASLYKLEAKASRRATLTKIADKIRNRDSDLSHASVIAAAATGGQNLDNITIPNLTSFYSVLFEIEQAVYGNG
jgi:nucleoside-diphosphate-sugar epimerase